jgi:Rps23 Pro-64 3,4-dihydroxylase Tpa1-like proline 4-hydroxylase
VIIKKLLAGATVGLLLVCALLYWSHARVTEANAALKADLVLIEGALEETREALAAAIAEKERVQEVMSRRLEVERQIQQRRERELRAAHEMLAKLRAEYEDIEVFLSLPVPGAFVDQWMRGRPHDSADEGGADPPAG